MKKITNIQAANLIANAKGDKFFTVTFNKRTTGEQRTMNCRKGVTKALQGGVAAYDFKERDLVCVYDVQAAGYRSIPLEGITEVKMEGEVYQVVKAADLKN
jgi:hypothetical protein